VEHQFLLVAWTPCCFCWTLLQINTLALWNMGRMIEPLLGSKPFLTVYLGSGEAWPAAALLTL
jgi:hypothetical protein